MDTKYERPPRFSAAKRTRAGMAVLASIALGGGATMANAAPFPAQIDMGSFTVDGGAAEDGALIYSSEASDSIGFVAGAAGDFNADGVDDFIIASPNSNANGLARSGRIYVLFGSNDISDGPFDLASLLTSNGGDGSQGVVFNGIRSFDQAGKAAASAGDVNNDGIDDLLIGSESANLNGLLGVGEAYVIFGSADDFDAEVDLSDLSPLGIRPGERGFFVRGAYENNQVGSAVAGGVDINHDGIDDIIISAKLADANGIANSGEVYVVFGAEKTNFEELNVASLIAGAGVAGFAVRGISSGDRVGGSLAGLKDFNGDGIDDLALSTSEASADGQFLAGQTYVIYGTTVAFDQPFDLADLLSQNGGDGTRGVVINGADPFDLSGFDIAGGCDINLDGVADIVISGEGANSDRGEVYVVYGRSGGFPAQLDLSDLQPINGGDGSDGIVFGGIDVNDFIGWSVAACGDVDNDGFPDVSFGAPNADDSVPGGIVPGEAYLIFKAGNLNEASLPLDDLLDGNGSIGTVLKGSASGDKVGSVTAFVGDVDADGVDDYVVGSSSRFFGPESGRGAIFLIPGRASRGFSQPEFELADLLPENGGNGSQGAVFNGLSPDDRSGDALSMVGDLNADGISDFVIGARNADPVGRNSAGETYVIFGREDGFDASSNLSTLLPPIGNGTRGFLLYGANEVDLAGFSVAGSGDVNDDGIDDLAVCAPTVRGATQQFNGACYIVYGRNTLFPAIFELSQLRSANGGDGSEGFVVTGAIDTSSLGGRVAGLGDTNGDGIDDFAISQNSTDPLGRQDAGTLYVVLGRASGFPAEISAGSIRSTAGRNGAFGYSVFGARAGDQLVAVGRLDDVNGDNVGDIVLGAPNADPGNRFSAGEAYVIYGRTGFPGNLDLFSLAGTPGGSPALGAVFRGVAIDDRAGTNVSSAGDFNGDGFIDLLIAAPFANSNGFGNGQSYLVYGSPSGFAPVLELSSLFSAFGGDGSSGFVINGAGSDVASIGDFNDDGIDDIAVGKREAAPDGRTSAGQTYVLTGKFESVGAEFEVASLLQSFGGDGSNGLVINGVLPGDFSGETLAGANDLDNDGIPDLLIGAPSADPNGVNSSGSTYVVLGRAFDAAADADSDGVSDDTDNCINAANPNQADTNGDSIGNACDPDLGPLTNDCIVNFLDLGVLRAAFFANPTSSNWNPDADMTGPAGTPDGVINFTDLGLMRLFFFGEPGPSAAGCN